MPRLNALPIVAGFIAAAAMALLLFSTFGVPGGVPAILLAVLCVALIAGANALAVHLAGGALGQDIGGLALRSCASVCWIAPFAVYLMSGSLFAAPLAAMIVVNAVPLFRSVRVARIGQTKASFNPDGMFQMLPSPPYGRLLSLVCAAGFVHSCVAANAAGVFGLDVVSVAAASAIIAWHAVNESEAGFQFNSPRQLLSSVLTLALAFLLTAGGLGAGYGDADEEDEAAEETSGGGGDYWGVFLWTGANDRPRLLTIPARPVAGLRLDEATKHPLKIRFDGVYWFFKWPDLKPPSRSTVMYGSPTGTALRSADSAPVIMEAHQPLLSSMSPAYFNRIDVTIRDADKFPGTVEMELILCDSSRVFHGTFSLGRIPLSSEPGRQDSAERQATVRFPVPDYPPIQVFNEVTIRFHLNRSRDTRSPRIAVEDLVLNPR